jgi:hypothetical protein
MNSQFQVTVDGTLTLINYDFLEGFKELSGLIEFSGKEISCLKFVEIREYDVPQPSYFIDGVVIEDLLYLFHRNMIEIINVAKSLKGVIIENFLFLRDEHFQYMCLSKWESLTTLKVIKCNKLTGIFFRWVANNCRSLIHYEMTCDFLPINLIYKCRDERVSIYYEILLEDLARLFTKSAKTLVSCSISIWQFSDDHWQATKIMDVCDAICKCSFIEQLNFMVGVSHFDFSQFVLLLKLPLLKSYMLSFDLVGKSRRTVIDFYSGYDCHTEGYLKLHDILHEEFRGNLKECGFFENLLSVFAVKDACFKHISCLSFSRLYDLTIEVLQTISNSSNFLELSSVKLLNCGKVYDSFHPQSEFLFGKLKKLKFLAIIEDGQLHSPTFIELHRHGFIFALMQNGLKWDIDEIKRFKKNTSVEIFDWLVKNSHGQWIDDEDEENSKKKTKD